MIDEKVVPSFWLSEFLHSETAARRAIDNTPGPAELANIRAVLAPGLQRIRETLGCPVFISSGYRCPALNRAIGGAKNSAHMAGLAADFVSPGYGPPKAIAKYLIERAPEIGFDQLILEGSPGWVHVGFPAPGQRPRREVLTATFSAFGVSYSAGLG